MKNIETLIQREKLSRSHAERIVETQFDLGGKSKKDMILALSGPNYYEKEEDVDNMRLEAFEKLDVISQFIVFSVLDSDFETENGVKDHFEYITKCLDAVKTA